MRLKDILTKASQLTRTGLWGPAANDIGPAVQRDTLAYIAKGDFERGDNTVRLAKNWERIADLVNNARHNLPEDYPSEAAEGVSQLHAAISKIAQRIEETSVFIATVDLDQQDVDDLITHMPHMATVASYYNGVIRDGTTFIGLDIDHENDQIHVEKIENGVADFARRHLHEVQMFAFRARGQMQPLTSAALTQDGQALSL